MAFPDYKHLREALLCLIYFRGGSGHEMRSSDTYHLLAKYFDLSPQELSEMRLFKDDRQEPLWNNMVQWTRNDLRKLGYIDTMAWRGTWRLSSEGIDAAIKLSHQYSKLNRS